jgi:tRNA (guanine37-N1)-methyltransferase
MGHSFDIIGDVAVVEVPEGEKPKEVAEAIKKKHPRVKTVLMKMGEREGVFRTRRFRKILGTDTETEHREHGCRFMLDVGKAYFSPREATERQRIAGMVKPGETVLVMFAGVGPFPVVIARKSPGVWKVYGIEINPDAFRYMVTNVRINKVGHRVVPVLGDVKKEAGKYHGRCDRVVMPLPKEGYKYLPEAFRCLKGSGGTIHFYSCGHGSGMFTASLDAVKRAAAGMNKKVRILDKRKVLPYGPGAWKVCIDFRVGG